MCLTAHQSQGMLIRRPKALSLWESYRGLPGPDTVLRSSGDANATTFAESQRTASAASRKRSNWGPVVATAAATVAVFGFLAFVLNQTPLQPRPRARTAAAQLRRRLKSPPRRRLHAPSHDRGESPCRIAASREGHGHEPQIGTTATASVAATPAAPNTSRSSHGRGPCQACSSPNCGRRIWAGLADGQVGDRRGRADAVVEDDRRCPGPERRPASGRHGDQPHSHPRKPRPGAGPKLVPSIGGRRCGSGGDARQSHQEHHRRPGRLAGRRRPAEAAHLLAARN